MGNPRGRGHRRCRRRGHRRVGRQRGDRRRRPRPRPGPRPRRPGRRAAAYGSYAELVADPGVDVVYVATTHAHHHEHALLAIEAGKHVLVEKAFTLTAAQAGDIVAAAAKRDVFCMEAMWMRMNPLVRRALEMARDGAIGRVLSVTADHGQRFAFDPKHRLFDLEAGGGALLDLGVYSATVAWLFLGEPSGMTTTGHLSPTGSDATMAMQWSYDDDRYAHVACTTESLTPCVATVVGTGAGCGSGSRSTSRATSRCTPAARGPRCSPSRCPATATGRRSPRSSAACGPGSRRARSSRSPRRWPSWR
ncbi:Gfo/Idh/MocA family protein [Actinokineospora soli]|uniref:Gfo/Idh/MocA family protein n=1 Tax=Actinokineospora soli TaxID=1048753 RepID=A0ABW2TM39_9PSEU